MKKEDWKEFADKGEEKRKTVRERRREEAKRAEQAYLVMVAEERKQAKINMKEFYESTIRGSKETFRKISIEEKRNFEK